MKTIKFKTVLLTALLIKVSLANPQWNLNISNNSDHSIDVAPTGESYCWLGDFATTTSTIASGEMSQVTITENNICSNTGSQYLAYEFTIDNISSVISASYELIPMFQKPSGYSSISFAPDRTYSSNCQKDSNSSVVNLDIIYTESGIPVLTPTSSKDWGC